MIFYNMGDNFMYLKKRRLSQAAYYRMLLPIFTNLKRIIHLDGDSLTFKDLGEMYQLEFNNKSIMGILDFDSYGIDYLGLKSEKFINTGVLLINLEKIRNDKKYYDLINITTKVGLKHEDQSAFNYILYHDIGILPYKYCIFNFYKTLDIQNYANRLRQKINVTEIEEAVKDPTIVHVLCKPWKSKNKYNIYLDKWIFFANKTDYYPEIVQYMDKFK